MAQPLSGAVISYHPLGQAEVLSLFGPCHAIIEDSCSALLVSGSRLRSFHNTGLREAIGRQSRFG
jgi:hypothetical protein